MGASLPLVIGGVALAAFGLISATDNVERSDSAQAQFLLNNHVTVLAQDVNRQSAVISIAPESKLLEVKLIGFPKLENKQYLLWSVTPTNEILAYGPIFHNQSFTLATMPDEDSVFIVTAEQSGMQDANPRGRIIVSGKMTY